MISLHKLFFTLFFFTLEIQKGICENGSYRLFGLKLEPRNDFLSWQKTEEKSTSHCPQPPPKMTRTAVTSKFNVVTKLKISAPLANDESSRVKQEKSIRKSDPHCIQICNFYLWSHFNPVSVSCFVPVLVWYYLLCFSTWRIDFSYISTTW